MAKKKISKWERNLETVKRAQQRAIDAIMELEHQGYWVSEDLKKSVFKPLKKRYSTKEAEKLYKGFFNARSIKATAIKRNKKNPLQTKMTKGFVINNSPQKIKNKINDATYSEQLKYRKDHESEDIAKQAYSQMKWAMENHPTRDVANTIKFIMDNLSMKTISYKDVGEAFKTDKWSEDEFIKNFSKAYNENEKRAMAYLNYFYKMGHSSEMAYASFIKQSRIHSEYAFGKTFSKMKDEDVVKLYDFFEDNEVWNAFKENFDPSDFNDVQSNTLFSTITDLLNEGISRNKVNNYLINGDIDGLEELLLSLKEKN